MVCCLRCGTGLSHSDENEKLAFICGSIMGDEYIESYFLCRSCGVYTVEVYHDRFLGDEDVYFRGPVTREDGDASVALIRQCRTPHNKKCRCPAHKSYFGSSLD